MFTAVTAAIIPTDASVWVTVVRGRSSRR